MSLILLYGPHIKKKKIIIMATSWLKRERKGREKQTIESER